MLYSEGTCVLGLHWVVSLGMRWDSKRLIYAVAAQTPRSPWLQTTKVSFQLHCV